MFSRFVSIIKEILFPIFCVQCNQEGEWWCQNCRNKNTSGLILACPVCALPNDTGRPCALCRINSPLDGVISLFFYSDKAPIGQLIKLFKYNYAADVVRLWQNSIANNKERLTTTLPHSSGKSIIPVPLYPRRERERGFNQAAVVGKIIAEELCIPLFAGQLKRVRATAQQAKLSRPDRHRNVAGAFVWQGNLPPASIILVDDVYTTGATMQECARVLKLAGAKEVWGLTLARD